MTDPIKTYTDQTPPLNTLHKAQRLRFQRFSMALATYVIVAIAAVLTTRLGLGSLSTLQWLMIIGVAIFGNAVFFFLFYTGRNLRFKDPSLTRLQILYSTFWGMIILHGLPNARPIVLMFYVPAFSFGMLQLNRREYFSVLGCSLGMYAAVLVLEYVQGRPGFNIGYELFIYTIFAILLSWTTFLGGFVYNIRNRLKMKNIELQNTHDTLKTEIEERKCAQIEKDNVIIDLQKALAQVETLSGMLPICASCKKIRDDKGYWNQIETYITNHSKAIFSHGLCPECAKKLYPDINIHKKKDK